jgi:hypothetical protein
VSGHVLQVAGVRDQSPEPVSAGQRGLGSLRHLEQVDVEMQDERVAVAAGQPERRVEQAFGLRGP